MTSELGKQPSGTHMLPNNIRKMFIGKSYQIVVNKPIPRPFSKNQNWAHHWINFLYNI